MKATRFGAVVLCMAGIALGVVVLRIEQARTAARMMAIEAEWIELRHEWWQLQTRAARLRTPDRLHERLNRFTVDLVPPVDRLPGRARLAHDRGED